MELTPNNLLIGFLGLFIIIYAYNDYIKPIITSLIQGKSFLIHFHPK